jgi:hypothetical protein
MGDPARAVWTLGASLFLLFIYGLQVDIPTQPTALEVGTYGRTACCAKVWEPSRLVDRDLGDRIRRRLRLPRALSGFGAFKGFLGWTAHNELARPGRKPQLEAPLRGASASRDDPSPPTQGIARGRNALRRKLRGMPWPKRARQRALGAPDLRR